MCPQGPCSHDPSQPLHHASFALLLFCSMPLCTAERSNETVAVFTLWWWLLTYSPLSELLTYLAKLKPMKVSYGLVPLLG